MEKPVSKEDSARGASGFETACGRFFLRFMIIIIPLLLADYASRFFWVHHRSKIERRFPVEVVRHPKPYVMFGGIADSTLPDGEKLNGLGYRGKALAIPKPPDEFRIFMLGGSTVFIGNPPISVLLEELFARQGHPNVRVYNFGVISSVSGMELARIVFEISELAPDFIVVYNGSNDVVLPFMCDPRPGYPFNFIVYENNPCLESDIRQYPTFALMLYGSNLARYLVSGYFMDKFVKMEQEKKKADWDSDDWRRSIAHQYVTNMVKASKTANAFGAGFCGFFQPMVYYRDNPSSEEQTESFRPQRRDHCIKVRELIREEIEMLPEEGRLAVIDLSDVFDSVEGQVFTDYTHTNQAGNDILAKALYEHIIARHKIK